jgi:hypothetical protein
MVVLTGASVYSHNVIWFSKQEMSVSHCEARTLLACVWKQSTPIQERVRREGGEESQEWKTLRNEHRCNTANLVQLVVAESRYWTILSLKLI